MSEETQNPFMEMYATWEKVMAESLDIMVRSPAFIASMAKLFENLMVSSEQIDRTVQSTLHAMNLPSGKDVRDIFEALGSLRLAVDELKGQVDLLLQQTAQAGRKRSEGRKKRRTR